MSPEYEVRLEELRRETAQHEEQLRAALGGLERAIPRPMEEVDNFLRDNALMVVAGAFIIGFWLGTHRD